MQQNTTISLNDLFKFLLRGLPLALLVAVAAALVAFQVTRNEDPTFETRASVLASQSDRSQTSFSFYTPPPLDVSAYRIAALSVNVLGDALGQLGVEAPDQFDIRQVRERIVVRTEETQRSGLIYIDAKGPTPEDAANTANAVARSLVNWEKNRATNNFARIVTSLEQQTQALQEQIRSMQATGASQSQIDASSSLLAETQQDLAFARAVSTSAVPLLDILELAPEPIQPSAPRPLFNATLAFVLGVLLAYGLLFLRQALDTRLRSVDDLAKVSGMPVLAEFPKLRKGTRRLPREASSYLRTNVLLATENAHPKVILVTSASSGEGKSSVAISLAESFARGEHRTLLVDADLRRPTIGQTYGLNVAVDVSLRSYLENLDQDFAPISIQVSRSQVLDVVPSFKAVPSPTDLLSLGFRDRLDEWRTQYDVIIIDSAPVLPVADTLIIAPLCTGTILVADANNADRRRVRDTVDLLQRVGVRSLGVVPTQLTRGAQSDTRQDYGYQDVTPEVDYPVPVRVGETMTDFVPPKIVKKTKEIGR